MIIVQRLKKSVKIKKILLVFSVIILTIVSSVMSVFGASAGNNGENYPVIPVYMELRYPDKAVFANITDRYHYENTVNHEEIVVSGRTIFSELLIRSIQNDGVLLRKGFGSEYTLAPIGFELTSPTFYLTREDGASSFNQVVPYVKIPDTVNVEGVLTYDVFFGGSEKVGTVERAFVSPLGSTSNLNLYTFNEINQYATLEDWTSVRISNLKFTTSTLSYPTETGGDNSVLSGTWVINNDIVPFIYANEAYVTMNIPFVSNGINFTGMVFGDSVELLYLNTVGQVERIQVWNTTLGWVNEEYRIIYFSDSYTWNDVVKSDDSGIYDSSADFKIWLQSNAVKKTNTGGYDGRNIFELRYQVQNINYIDSYLNQYNNEWSIGVGDSYEQIFNDGFALGNYQGLIDGERIGYNKAQQEKAPNVTAWLASAASGFLAFEIIPGISLLSILGIMVALSLAIVLLKFFAGG